MHAALREEDAVDGVHVSNDGIDRKCLLWANAGIHRLEGVDLLSARVFEEFIDFGGQSLEAADRNQFRQIRSQ